MAQLKPSNSNSLIFNGNLVVCHIEREIAQSLGLKEYKPSFVHAKGVR